MGQAQINVRIRACSRTSIVRTKQAALTHNVRGKELKRCYIQQLKSFIAKHILPIVNPEMFIIAGFFWIERLLEYFELCWYKKSWPTFFIS